jgi:hypothetical protein
MQPKRRMQNLSMRSNVLFSAQRESLFPWLRLAGSVRCDRQLQHRGILSGAQVRQQHDLAIWEFECIVMGARVIPVDLPEPGNFMSERPRMPPEDAQLESGRLPLNPVFEHDLGAGEQADRQVRLPNRRKPARMSIPELRRYQSISDPCRSGRDTIQAVVAHGRGLPSAPSPANHHPNEWHLKSFFFWTGCSAQ